MRVVNAFFAPLLHELKNALPKSQLRSICSGIEIKTALSEFAEYGILPNVLAHYRASRQPGQEEGYPSCRLVIRLDLCSCCALYDYGFYIDDMKEPYQSFAVRKNLYWCVEKARDDSLEAYCEAVAAQIIEDLKDEKCFTL